MPKGVQFSSSATTLLPPRAKAPAPKSNSDGDDSFETALKKAKPDSKPTRATKSTQSSAATTGKKAKQDATPAKKDGTDDASDENKTTDPGAEKTDDINVTAEVAQQVVDANKHAPKTSDHSDASADHADATPQPVVVAVPAPQKAPVQDATPKNDEVKSPAPATPALVKGLPLPADESEPTETDALKPKQSAARQAVAKVSQKLQSDQTDDQDDQGSDDDDSDVANASKPQNVQTSQTLTKSTASSTASKHAAALDVAAGPKPDAEQRSTTVKANPNPVDDAPPQAAAPTTADVSDDLPVHHDPVDQTVDAPLAIDAPAPKPPVTTTVAAAEPAPPPPRPEQDFASANHDRIVSSVKTQLLPNGGTMQLRLDPPNLGPLQVSVHMADGSMTASFETSSDQATRLLSHSLGQLKTALETQGVSVEKLHVEQSPKSQQSSSGDSDQQKRDSQQQQDGSDRDQQRREMLNRMWKRLALGRDPLDTVA